MIGSAIAGDMRKGPSRRLRVLLAVVLSLSGPTHAAEPEPHDVAHAGQAFESATLHWNWEARDIVRRNRVDPLWATRTFAMVSLAQYDTARAIDAGAGVRARLEVAISASAATVLIHLYPHELPAVVARLETRMRSAHGGIPSAELARARRLGESIARDVLASRADDGAISLEAIDPPPWAGAWRSDEDWAPLRPYWGRVRPFLIEKPDVFETPPPPAADSARFREALAVVRDARNGVSAGNERIVKKWADGPGTVTPPGHWNVIATELIRRHSLDELESARVLAQMNMALMDAGILCWRTKFTYWLRRPSQVDPRIVASLPNPNFPSYPSGHAAFSGAASEFLSRAFPAERDALNRWAQEAADSRVLGGIHYPFDSEVGLQQGRRVGALAAARYRSDVAQSVASEK